MFDKEKWLKAWSDNYKGVSEQAKELEKFMKANYKKHNYIPWATMVRMLYEQDPMAEIELIHSPNDREGIVHTSWGSTDTDLKEEKSKDGVIVLSKTDKSYSKHCANMIVISCVFMGKTFTEYYPIQDNSYNAPYYYDSNMVNKAIQRAKAKIISIATGLAFRLYEDGDLQFEDDKTTEQKTIVEKTKAPIKKEQVIVKEKVEEKKIENKESILTKEDESIVAAARLVEELRGADEELVTNILKSVNSDMVKIYKFSLSMKDTDEELITKISQIKNLTTFARVIKMKLEKGIVK